MSRWMRLGLPVAAVVLALVFSGVVATLVLLFTGDDVRGVLAGVVHLAFRA
ncbi:MAG: hypothetical protein R2709_06250 [Marmoricola sp.]